MGETGNYVLWWLERSLPVKYGYIIKLSISQTKKRMYSKINLSEVKQCNQVWDTMQICETGRLCVKCNHIIIDFRGKTEWEIALRHAQSEKKVCGLYDKKVLTKNENLNAKQSNNISLIVAGALGVLTTSSSAFSQNERDQFMIEKTEEVIQEAYLVKSNIQNNELKKLNYNQIDNTYLITGILTNKTGEPLIGGIILIKGTEKGIITDIEGRFLIDIPEEIFKMDSITIVASYIGYGREEMEIPKTDFNQKNKLDLKINMDKQVESAVFSVKRPPLHKRVGYGIKNMFRKNK